MFYCDECADLNKWPKTLHKSEGGCEVCNKQRVCNDRPSRLLPESPPPWSPSWPTKPGWYWFYGKRFRLSDKDEFHPVEVHGTADPGVMAYVTRGHFLHPEEGATGLWLPMQTPELPEGG